MTVHVHVLYCISYLSERTVLLLGCSVIQYETATVPVRNLYVLSSLGPNLMMVLGLWSARSQTNPRL
jgi:flagellar biosynthesis regulator FlbT